MPKRVFSDDNRQGDSRRVLRLGTLTERGSPASSYGLRSGSEGTGSGRKRGARLRWGKRLVPTMADVALGATSDHRFGSIEEAGVLFREVTSRLLGNDVEPIPGRSHTWIMPFRTIGSGRPSTISYHQPGSLTGYSKAMKVIRCDLRIPPVPISHPLHVSLRRLALLGGHEDGHAVGTAPAASVSGTGGCRTRSSPGPGACARTMRQRSLRAATMRKSIRLPQDGAYNVGLAKFIWPEVTFVATFAFRLLKCSELPLGPDWGDGDRARVDDPLDQGSRRGYCNRHEHRPDTRRGLRGRVRHPESGHDARRPVRIGHRCRLHRDDE